MAKQSTAFRFGKDVCALAGVVVTTLTRAGLARVRAAGLHIGTNRSFSRDLMRRVSWLWLQTIKLFCIRSLRVVRAVRRIAKIIPVVELLYVSALSFFLLFFCVNLINPPLGVLAFFFNVGGISIFLAVFGDIVCQLTRIVRIAYVQTVGKIVIGAVSAVMFYVSVSMSKQIVHEITGADPKYFPEFSGLFAVVAAPILCMRLWGLLAIPFIGFQILIALLEVLVAIKALWYPRGKNPPFRPSFAPAISILRPILIMALILDLGHIQLLGVNNLSFTSLATRSLVLLEYKRNSKCLGLPERAVVAYLANDLISVAIENNGQFEFSIQTCRFSHG